LPEALIQVEGLSKRFGGVRALDDVDLAVRQGSVHALVGENGAGKSTLGKVIAGVHHPDAGTISVEGRPVHYRSPHDALKDGITMIAQELALLPHRTVSENVFLGIEHSRLGVVDRGSLRRRYRALVAEVGFAVPGEVPAGSLTVADQQKVEILRAVAREARVIVMDEPTAALGREETERLLELVRLLVTRGTTIVFVSHFLDEALAISDEVTVLRDGRVVKSAAAAAETPETLITAMLGRSLDMTFPEKRYPSADASVVLSVKGLRRVGSAAEVSFDVRAGEIVGMAGLIGSGRSELARAVFGADARDAGSIELDGKQLRIRSPRSAIRAGIAMLPESRKEQGLQMNRSVVENVTLPHLRTVSRAGVMAPLKERRAVTEMTTRVDVRTSRLSAPLRTLSGGNQQKALFARWLLRTPRIVIADEPTRGVDVGAKLAIYELLVSLAAEGMAVLVISSELEEILGLAHRILVVRGGEITTEFDGRTATEDAVMAAAFGAAARGAA
jgi:simple sugar transport system ATP-binding protein/ribose transport system ATP-binding protein